jgi:hypothetical protein
MTDVRSTDRPVLRHADHPGQETAQNAAAVGPPARRSILRLSKKKVVAIPAPGAAQTAADGPPLSMPNERDTSIGQVNAEPQPVIIQAKADLDAGLVDTELRGAAGLDDVRRRALLRASA